MHVGACDRDVGNLFSHDTARVFVLAQAGKARMPQMTVWCPLGKFDLRE